MKMPRDTCCVIGIRSTASTSASGSGTWELRKSLQPRPRTALRGQERLIGSIRRECLDHVIVLDEKHLQKILASYFEYYNHSRMHLSLDRNSPIPRKVEPLVVSLIEPPVVSLVEPPVVSLVEPLGTGKVVAIPQVGGLPVCR